MSTSKSRASKNKVALCSADPKNPNCIKIKMTAKATPATARAVRILLWTRFSQAKGMRIGNQGPGIRGQGSAAVGYASA